MTVKSNPTGSYNRKLVNIIARIKKENKIAPGQYDFLYPTSENVPCLYCTPRMHKVNTPLRPIVDYTGSIAYSTSRSLADLLPHLFGKAVHHVENTRRTKVLGDNEILIPHEVVSLFTNTPIPRTLHIVRRCLKCVSKLWERRRG